jgi:hypothetical protein
MVVHVCEEMGMCKLGSVMMLPEACGVCCKVMQMAAASCACMEREMRREHQRSKIRIQLEKRWWQYSCEERWHKMKEKMVM